MQNAGSLFSGRQGNETVKAALYAAEEGEEVVGETTTSPSPTEKSPKRRPCSIVLVDFDNVVVTAGEHGFPVSFTRLKTFLQQFGDIVFAFVFVSWRYREEIRVLFNAGFYPIVCPPTFKYKDAVDQVLARMAQSAICDLKESIAQVVIVSCDTYFNPIEKLARDHGLNPIRVNVLAIREEIEGEDGAPQVYLAREGQRFGRILVAYEKGLDVDYEKSPLHLPFLKDIVAILAKRDESRRMTFAEIQRYIPNLLDSQWNSFKRTLLRSALSALKEKDALIRSEDFGSAFYTLNRESTLVKKLLA